MTHAEDSSRDAVVGAEAALRVTPGAQAGELLETVRDEAGDVPVAAVGSTGIAGVEPLLLATQDGTTRFYANCEPETGSEVARAVAEGWTPPDGDWAADHVRGSRTLPAPDRGPLSVGRRDALGRVGWVGPTHRADHEASGGLEALEVAAEPAAVLDRLGSLAGRGWADAAADAPVAEQWRTARTAEGEPAVVVNAHGDPADRLLMDASPLAALEGALVAARTVGATEVFAFLNEADADLVERAEAAVDAIQSAEDDVPIEVVTGPDEYKAAEPTMAIEAIEGNHRLEARRSPPGPETYGLHGRPTLVHTPRTLVQVVRAATGESEPTRLVSVSGAVAAPGTVELTEGEALAAALDAVEIDRAMKAACVGGRFGGITDNLDVPCAPDALAEAGLGTGGTVEVLAEGTCLVAFAGERAAFAEAENCGRCVPCREGSTQLAGLLRDVYEGTYEPAKINELARVMESSSICDFGVEASRPATTAMDAFEAEFRAHADGTCPTGACDTTETPEVST